MILVGVVLAIAALDVLVLWLVRPAGARISPEGIIVLEQVLGVLLAAVAVELIVIGLGQLGIIDGHRRTDERQGRRRPAPGTRTLGPGRRPSEREC